MSTQFIFAACQMQVSNNKSANIEKAQKTIAKAADKGARMVCLPECWNAPYETTSFAAYAEEIPAKSEDLKEASHPSTFALSEIAQRLEIYLVGGSIPERSGDKLFNTCVVFDPKGHIIGKHRKVHLFDIDVPGKITFKESDTLSPGNEITVCDTSLCSVGVAICYDIRFPELSMLMRKKGAKMLIFPGAFNLTTGPAHWELLARSRAVDNQLYVAIVSPARNPENGYQAWGHSSIISPWGDVMATCSHEEAIVYAQIDLDKVDEMRQNIPVSTQKRSDLYKLDECN